jgi:hypothetical protein
MDPQTACAAILVLCLALISATYALGVEVGKVQGHRASAAKPRLEAAHRAHTGHAAARPGA